MDGVRDLNAAACEMALIPLAERGLAVRNLRGKAQIGIRVMADLCGITQSFLSKFERGLNDVSVETYARIREVKGRIDRQDDDGVYRAIMAHSIDRWLRRKRWPK